MGNMLVEYIRNRETKAPTGVVVALGKDQIGWSLLNPTEAVSIDAPFNLETKDRAANITQKITFLVTKDRWNKEKALAKAVARAKTNVNWIDNIQTQVHSKNRPLGPRTYYRFRFDLIPALEKMRERAAKYFKD